MSESVIVIGCCGFGENVVKSEKPFINDTTSYKRKPETNYIIHKDFEITHNVSEQFAPTSIRPDSVRPLHKQIFQ